MRNKLFIYPGAKSRVVQELISYFPKNYQELHWLDAFGGSGIVTYHKQRSLLETFNDLDKGISAIFYCLLFKFEEFCFRLQMAQHSEQLFKWIKTDEIKEEDSVINRAIKKIYLLQMSYSGKGKHIAFRRQTEKGKRSYRVKLFYFDLFNAWRERFEDVQIFSRPANDLIELLDTEEFLVYCDPPYTVTEKGNHYGLNFTEKDHEELYQVLNNMKGKFLLSYDDCDYIRDLYKGFHFHEMKIQYSFKGTQKKDSNTELLISNYSFVKKQKLPQYFGPVNVEKNVEISGSH